MTARAPLLGLCLAAGVAFLPATAGTAPGEDSRPAIVILKDGTHLEAVKVQRAGSELIVSFADGRTELYPTSIVALYTTGGARTAEAGGEAPATAAPRKKLGSVAGTIALSAPTESRSLGISTGGPQGSAETPADGADERGAAPPPVDPVAAATLAKKKALGAVEARVSALASGWSRYSRQTGELDRLCSGYVRGRVGGGCSGGGVLLPRRETTQCRQALATASRTLDGLQSDYERVWTEARKRQLLPGDVRRLLSSHGMTDIDTQLKGARRALDAWRRPGD